MEYLSQDMRYETNFQAKMPSLSPAILSIITPFALLFSHPSWTKAVTSASLSFATPSMEYFSQDMRYETTFPGQNAIPITSYSIN